MIRISTMGRGCSVVELLWSLLCSCFFLWFLRPLPISWRCCMQHYSLSDFNGIFFRVFNSSSAPVVLTYAMCMKVRAIVRFFSTRKERRLKEQPKKVIDSETFRARYSAFSLSRVASRPFHIPSTSSSSSRVHDLTQRSLDSMERVSRRRAKLPASSDELELRGRLSISIFWP